MHYIFKNTIAISAVVDKPFVDKIADKTAILRKYDISTKILFCRHNNAWIMYMYHFETEIIILKQKLFI